MPLLFKYLPTYLGIVPDCHLLSSFQSLGMLITRYRCNVGTLYFQRQAGFRATIPTNSQYSILPTNIGNRKVGTYYAKLRWKFL